MSISRRFRTFFFAATLCAVASVHGVRAAAAQEPEPGYGSRVRVTAPGLGLERAVGVVTGHDGAGLSVLLDDELEPRLIAPGQASSLEVSVRRKGHGRIGVVVGAAVMSAAGYASAMASADGSRTCHLVPGPAIGLQPVRVCSDGPPPEDRARTRAVTFGAVGALVGLAIGRSVRSDEWAPAGAGWGVAPSVSGEGVGVTVRVGLRLL